MSFNYFNHVCEIEKVISDKVCQKVALKVLNRVAASMQNEDLIEFELDIMYGYIFVRIDSPYETVADFSFWLDFRVIIQKLSGHFMEYQRFESEFLKFVSEVRRIERVENVMAAVASGRDDFEPKPSIFTPECIAELIGKVRRFEL